VVPKVRDRSFRSVATEHAIGAATLIAATRALHTERGVAWPTGPFAVGIDEHSFSGTDFVQTITDVTHHTLLHLLPNTRQKTLRAWIQAIPLGIRRNITAVCIDMCQSYRATLGQELPGTPIVVDPFHIIQHLNKELSELRLVFTRREYPLPKRLLEKNKEDLTVREKGELQTMFKHYPAIAELWRIKEIVRRMYRLKDPHEASARYRSILNGLRGDVRHRFARLYRTLKNWEQEILNYFTHRITNGYTEGVHTRIKLLKRISYGFRNKENYIAKMTLAFLPLATLVSLAQTSTCLT
jgi:transposase